MFDQCESLVAKIENVCLHFQRVIFANQEIKFNKNEEIKPCINVAKQLLPQKNHPTNRQ